MKTLFIKAKSRSKVNPKKILEISKKLPKNLAIAYSIQFEDIAKDIKNILSKDHKITSFIQVLGCSNPIFPKTTQAVLLIGSGRFHGVSLAYRTKLPIYILERNNLSKVTREEIEKLQKRQKAAYLKFLNSNKVGILVSTKPGQNRLKRALKLKKRIGKKTYFFLANTINTMEFENFKISSYINTACPQLELDTSSIINMNRIKP